jgi:hypothetical protein
MLREPALLTSAGRMPERSQHRVSGGQDGRSERPATGRGQPRTTRHRLEPHQFQRCHGVLSVRLWKQETVSMANMMPR